MTNLRRQMDVLIRAEDSQPNKSCQEAKREGIHLWGTHNSISTVLDRRLEGASKEAGECQMCWTLTAQKMWLGDQTVKRKRNWVFPSLQLQIFRKIAKHRFWCSSCPLWTSGPISHLRLKVKLKLVWKTVARVTDVYHTIQSRLQVCFLLHSLILLMQQLNLYVWKYATT